MSLSTLLINLETRQVTCLKMDVEGMELSIIQQLQNLQATLSNALKLYAILAINKLF